MTARLASLAACLMAAGCTGGDVPKPRPIPVARDIVEQVRSAFEGYSKGQPLSSEQQLFDTWIAELQTSEAAGADLLGAGLREIAASPARAKAVATGVLAKLPARPSGGTPANGPPASR